jgi:hypothetical protein
MWNVNQSFTLTHTNTNFNAKSERQKKRNNAKIYIFGLPKYIDFSNYKWLINFYISYLVYSQIWVNVPMDYCHFFSISYG